MERGIMRIEIDSLTEAELIDLNNRIVERLRFLHQARSHKRMLDFRIGDRVSFQPEDRDMVGWNSYTLQQEERYCNYGRRSEVERSSSLLAAGYRIQQRYGWRSEYHS